MAITINDWMVYIPVVIVIIIAIMGYLVSKSAVGKDGWYDQIKKSQLNPKGWVFGFIWFILYIFIAIVWARANYYLQPGGPGISSRTPEQVQNIYVAVNVLFVINIIANLAWSFLFFGDGNFIYSFIAILIMIVTVIFLIYYLRYDWLSILLLTCYLIWLFFALYLNFYVLRHNKVIHT